MNKNEVLIDDRECSAGCKFHDADLIGIPYRLVIGKDMELFFKKEKVNIELLDSIVQYSK